VQTHETICICLEDDDDDVGEILRIYATKTDRVKEDPISIDR
jgi:hypothetical protein